MAKNSPERNSWAGMKQRCYYPRHIEFHRYGGRGIKVCERWRASFAAFLEDMGPRPERHSLDRIDLDGDYEPANCRWASKHDQSRNTSKNVFVEHAGRRLTLAELAESLGLSYFRLHAYYRRRGLSLELAIEKVKAPGINRPSKVAAARSMARSPASAT